MQLFYGTYFIISVVFQLKFLKGSSRKQTRLTNKVVNKVRRVSIANRQYHLVFKRVLELKFFDRAISNEKKVEKEIEIKREAAQLIHGAGQKFEGNPNSNCCRCGHESKIKSFRKVTSRVAQGVNFSS